MKKTDIFEQVVEIMRERRHQSTQNGMWTWKSASTIAKTLRISKRFSSLLYLVKLLNVKESQCHDGSQANENEDGWSPGME